ncbi:MAG TPA: methyltransferase domain-containing protein [Rhizomicrobium sp.]
MTARRADGSAGDADYGVIGKGYAHFRRPDARIASAILAVLGDAKTVLNVGAGTGSYEPVDRAITAVEPSAAMRAQRPLHLPRAIDAVAEALPFADKTFDAAMATFSVHQWPDLAKGLREMRRVTRGPVAVMTGDPEALDRFWLADYAPEVIATEARRYPTIAAIATALGGAVETIDVPIPLDCRDGFNEAYYGRPEMLLDPNVRLACSAWSFVAPDAIAHFENDLKRDLDSGAWDARYGHLRTQPTFDGSLRLVVSRASGRPWSIARRRSRSQPGHVSRRI